jgi:aminopeptidase N
MANALSYFTNYFGGYTFGDFRGTVQPFNQGQGFPTMLLLPAAKGMSEANRNSFSFIAHETSHQWWGNIVAWRSYRDQWLSEGFAEYSGILYTAFRQDWKNAKELIKTARFDMEAVITGDKGNIGKVAESGPMIFGSRLNTRLTQNSYETIIYTKGALVMRMLHFLFYDANSKEPDKAFFAMLADFVKRYENKAATTEEFIQVAGEHFSRTPIARKLGVADLNWFFQQWVFEAKYPSYRLEYSIVEEGGKYFLTGTVYQDNAGPNWVMPLPVVLKIGGQPGQVIVLAKGPECPVTKIALPAKPDSVELDPDLWILSEKTITKKK